MKKAILLHGWPDKEEFFDASKPSSSNSQWLPWLQKQLVVRGIDTQTPEMLNAYEPNYEIWRKTLENLRPDENTILVGHSCGGGFIVRWLSENNIKVDKVFLVAPWIDLTKEHIDPKFFDFKIDESLRDKTNGITIIYSDNDYEDVGQTVNFLKGKIRNVKLIEMKGMGHFVTEDLGSNEFPALLREIVN